MNRRSGIYRIVCLVDGKSYIGQSVNVDARAIKHLRLLLLGKHFNLHLQNAFNLYGAQNFIIEVIELCDEILLTEREQFWIDSYGFENLYNICPAAGSPRGVVRSEEFKKKLSNTLSGKPPSDEWRQMISEANSGRIFSEEHRNKISQASKGRHHSESVKSKISESSKGRKMSRDSVERASAARKGQKRTPEQRQRMSEGRRKAKEKRNEQQN